MLRIAVLISGSGSNLQSIIDAIENKGLNCNIKYVISDKESAYGIERAEKHGIKTYVFNKKDYADCLSEKIFEVIKDDVDFIVLAGFLSILKGDILKHFKDKIINIHPSLIPSFCGNGMYGIKVHKAAIDAGVKVSGCTVHFVDEGTDTGPIILQRTVPVYYEDDAETLQKRVLVEEHVALPSALKLISENKVSVENKKVRIL
ncbi:phosphoribosylglycinamide formyltransferase [Clostridium sp. 19966]|uniref:phosphoribosylglycinamide formyltransferase n=1 Tax=Clostridium sp. 19966 TaxID=2768166 RepID=UPI0028DD7F4E|nr:phosphoribosylglycinamide formyltransferase [Clostridium sp. 19966]MDT8716354.1 phosphoribosylglycinamide formyltransferase [Clostridium sp. 19966]